MLVNCCQLYFSEKKLNLEEVGDLGQDQTDREVTESECKSQSAEIAVSNRLSHDSYFSLNVHFSTVFICWDCGILFNCGFFVCLLFSWNPGMFQQVVDVSL